MRSSLLAVAIVALLAPSLAACSHSPETVVHFAAPTPGWEVREANGGRLCAVPCVVGMGDHEIVVLTPPDGTRFVVSQDGLGAGAFLAAVRVRKEPKPGAVAVRAFSDVLLIAGGAAM